MRGLNEVQLVGFAGAEPEMRTSKAGRAWCTMSLATHRNVRDDNGEWAEETDWHDIRAFGDVAQSVVHEVAKGVKVLVEGSIVYDHWTDDQGNKRKSTRILATRVKAVANLQSEFVLAAAADRAPAQPELAAA